MSLATETDFLYYNVLEELEMAREIRKTGAVKNDDWKATFASYPPDTSQADGGSDDSGGVGGGDDE